MQAFFRALVGTMLACGFLACEPTDVTGPDGSVNIRREVGITNAVEPDAYLTIVLGADELAKDLGFGKTTALRFNASLPYGQYSVTVTFVAKGYQYKDGEVTFLGCDRYRVTIYENSSYGIEPWGINNLSLSECGE